VLGALQMQQEAGPLANSAITSAYDELGRLSSRTVQGAGAETFQYDAIGRLTNRASDLGAFTLAISDRPSRSPAASSPAARWPRPGATSPTPTTADSRASTTSA
jgi:YD repeat-containing protein